MKKIQPKFRINTKSLEVVEVKDVIREKTITSIVETIVKSNYIDLDEVNILDENVDIAQTELSAEVFILTKKEYEEIVFQVRNLQFIPDARAEASYKNLLKLLQY